MGILLEMEPLAKMLKLTLQTGYIKNAKASSLLIIAKAESGKTESMEQFKFFNGVYYTNDITPKVIVDKLLPMIDSDEMRHLMIPDVLTAVERNRATRQHLVNILKTIIEEGVTRLDAFHMRYEPRFKKTLQAGLITAITGKSYQEFKKDWVKIGFLSRMVPFTYNYTMQKVDKILESIAQEEYFGDNPKHKILERKRRIEVKGDPLLFAQFKLLVSDVGRAIDAYGTRMQKMFQTLSKANALLNGRTEVTQTDIDAIKDLSRWINYDFNPL